jgi:endoglucanase
MKYLLSLLLLFILSFTACSTEPKAEGEAPTVGIVGPLDPYEQNAKLGRGINFGNALEAPNEGEWGFSLREEYFRLVKSKGFNSVRIPIKWSAHTSDSTPYTIEENFFERVDWAIEQSLANNLMVMINMHHYDEIFVNPAAEIAKFLSIWEQISERYANQPAEVLFEILNEPHDKLTAELWNELLPQALNIIREKNPYRTVVIGAAEWGGIPGLQKLIIPSDSNLIVTVHYYEPFQFTHQGADWVQGVDANAWLGTRWMGTPAEVNGIRDHFQTIVDWGKQRNVPINIGEFGAFSRADSPSRGRWTREVVRFALEKNMSYHYWEFGSGFGVFNPNTMQWDIELLNALTETEAN